MHKAPEVYHDKPKKPTLREIADLAGVGTATVERVLNERGMVAPRTAERVIRAAKTLGVRRPLPRPYRAAIRIEVFLPGFPTLFHKRLEDGFIQAKSGLGADVIVHRTHIGEAETARMTERIRAAASTRKGLIIYAPDVPEVMGAIDKALERKVPVVTVVTPLESRSGVTHVGIDQYEAGRTAGYLLGGFIKNPGSIVLICGRQSIRAHSDRVTAFKKIISERFPDLKLDIIIEGWDDLERTGRFLREYLNRKPEPVAIYDTTAAPREVGRVLKEFGLAGKIVYIGHEITRATIELLRERILTLVIDQNPELHARRALQILLYTIGYSDIHPPPPAIPFSIVTPENLDFYTQLPALTAST